MTVLLNPDTELVDDSVHELAALARIQPRALHAPRLLEPDGSVQRSAHPLPGTVGALLPALVHPPLLPRALRERAEPYRSERSRTVGWAIAACLAADTALLRELGPFDPSIHLLAEDMELGLRARARGVPTVLHPLAARPAHRRARDPARRRAVRAARAPPPRGGRVGARTRAPAPWTTWPSCSPSPPGSARAPRWAGDATRERAQLAALRREIGS